MKNKIRDLVLLIRIVCTKYRYSGIQLTIAELFLVAKIITEHQKSNVLIFGLGYDTLVYKKLNFGGRTVFLEDDTVWLNKITDMYPDTEVYMVHYETTLAQWRSLLENQADVMPKLPQTVIDTKWDVILVDAPQGWGDATPGRMSSIYAASKLIKNGGDVFVHDCNREVERQYSDTYLGKGNLMKQVNTVTALRHYKIR